MIDLEQIQIDRAEEQMASYNGREPTTHDDWALRGDWQGHGPVRSWKRERCLACGARCYHGSSYCSIHLDRVRSGIPVDVDLIPGWREARRVRAPGLVRTAA